MNPDFDRQPQRNPWPFPGDTELQRARRYVHAYRQHLKTANPDLCAALDDAARSYGDHWVCGGLLTIPDDQLITTDQAAELAGVDSETVRQWRKRGYLSRNGNREYLQVKGLSERRRPMFRASDIKEIAETTRWRRTTRTTT
ncbi:hypothetical protein O7626_39980 [Micromonospora sp. WMMD1102]|uniref:hypothetical protein n=1 Tax=Micromonospora sp. WMMD1102 TaxID=3016105 RepID=UPI002415341C|nr:hypothetical protein [Micromonospora sp. WMMD1102]MDG4791996.1 hypothetical protein [Micromonospora sp. WMMD1102]